MPVHGGRSGPQDRRARKARRTESLLDAWMTQALLALECRDA